MDYRVLIVCIFPFTFQSVYLNQLQMSNVLVIGGGGREHALAWKLKKSPKVATVFVVPGNGAPFPTAGKWPISVCLKRHANYVP